MAIIGDTNCINHNAIQCHVIELMRPGSCRIPVEQELRVCLPRRSFEAGGDNIGACHLQEAHDNDLVSDQAIDFVGYHHLGFVLRSGGLPSVERRFVPVDNVVVVLRPVQPVIFQSPSQVSCSF